MGATPQHLSLDDLFAPLPDHPMLGGTGPFVINLSSSNVPVSLPNNGISVAPNTRVYQIRCVEDRSVRYRLRLGPFLTEAQANAALAVVRDKYPAALTATAIPSDLESFADLQFETLSAEAAAPALQSKPAAVPEQIKPEIVTAELSFPPLTLAPSPPPVAAAVALAVPVAPILVAPPAPEPPVLTLSTVEYTPPVAPIAHTGASESKSSPPLAELVTLELLAEPMPAAVAAAVPAPAPAAPKTPAKKSLIESLTALGFPLTNASKQVPVRLARSAAKAAPTAKPAINAAPKPPTPAVVKPAAVRPVAAPAAKAAMAASAPPHKPMPAKPVLVGKPAAPAATAVKAPARPAATSWPTAEELDKRPLSLESTQTMRTLTASELESATKLRWFVVELATSERAFDPDAVPNLDIFSVYRLYSVESSNQGTIKHTLRLGFFSEAIAAQAVADYLSSHYDKPAVARVSIAERERFSEQGIQARKNVEATGRHAVIEITDERYVREPRALS